MKRLLMMSLAASVFLSSCGKNLDAQCTELFQDMAKEFDDILDENSETIIVERLKTLNHQKRILSLRDKTQKRVSDKMRSGEIWTDFNPNAGPRPEPAKIVVKAADRRKAIAMNAFNRRWVQVSLNAKDEAGLWNDDPDNVLFAIGELQVSCNHTLR